MPHVDDRIRQWRGDSRGRWEGDTLVVETTNFYLQTAFSERQGSTPALHLVERFTRRSADILVYEATMTDPATWTSPWTFEVPMVRSDEPVYEYACHEGNYGMDGIMAGARADEAEAAEDRESIGPSPGWACRSAARARERGPGPRRPGCRGARGSATRVRSSPA